MCLTTQEILTNEKKFIWLVKESKTWQKINGTETNASLQHHTECIQKSVTENVTNWYKQRSKKNFSSKKKPKFIEFLKNYRNALFSLTHILPIFIFFAYFS